MAHYRLKYTSLYVIYAYYGNLLSKISFSFHYKKIIFKTNFRPRFFIFNAKLLRWSYENKY